MPNSVPSLSGIGATIPHFFFDAIGRMVPGAYVLTGVYILNDCARNWTNSVLNKASGLANPTARQPDGLLIFLLFLCFLGVAYFLGFLLGAISH